LFLAGVSCIGKTAIGACLARRLGCAFFDLDAEIEKHFGKPIERLRAETPTLHSFRKQFSCLVSTTPSICVSQAIVPPWQCTGFRSA
jgi:shikimate kinase